jgi:hypothetical protein
MGSHEDEVEPEGTTGGLPARLGGAGLPAPMGTAPLGTAPLGEPLESALVRAFADAEASLRPVRPRVLARLDTIPAPRAREDARRRAPLPFLGHKRTLFLAVNALAAALLLTAYAGYLTVIKVQRQALAAEARHEVKNLAIVIRALRDRTAATPAASPAGTPAPSLAGALACLGIERDPFGNPFAFAEPDGRIWSYGVNGRNEQGGGDDIVAFLR